MSQSDYTNKEFHDACQEVIMNPARFINHMVPTGREAMCAYPERPIDGSWVPWAALGCRGCAIAIQGHIVDAMRKGMKWVMPTTVGSALTVTGFRGATLFIEATDLLNQAGQGIEPAERKSLLPDEFK